MDFEFSSPPLFLMEPLTSVLFLRSDSMDFIWKPTYHCVGMRTDQDFGVWILVSPGLVLESVCSWDIWSNNRAVVVQMQWSQCQRSCWTRIWLIYTWSPESQYGGYAKAVKSSRWRLIRLSGLLGSQI